MNAPTCVPRFRTRRHPRWLDDVRAAAFVAGLVIGPAAQAQVIRTDLDITDGPVNSMVESDGRLYIGGQFTHVGPATGNCVSIDAATGQPLWLPRVNGIVTVVTPDGSGGWYLGGTFTEVAGVPRYGLAHILADHSVAAWNPAPDYNGIDAIVISGGAVYVGGYFNSIGGQLRHNIAALDATTGAATAWAPNADNGVFSLVVSGSTVYAGGQFTNIGGTARNHIAALDALSGGALPWNPNADGNVSTLLLDGSVLYVGGTFANVGAAARANIAAARHQHRGRDGMEPRRQSIGLGSGARQRCGLRRRRLHFDRRRHAQLPRRAGCRGGGDGLESRAGWRGHRPGDQRLHGLCGRGLPAHRWNGSQLHRRP